MTRHFHFVAVKAVASGKGDVAPWRPTKEPFMVVVHVVRVMAPQHAPFSNGKRLDENRSMQWYDDYFLKIGFRTNFLFGNATQLHTSTSRSLDGIHHGGTHTTLFQLFDTGNSGATR